MIPKWKSFFFLMCYTWCPHYSLYSGKQSGGLTGSQIFQNISRTVINNIIKISTMSKMHLLSVSYSSCLIIILYISLSLPSVKSELLYDWLNHFRPMFHLCRNQHCVKSVLFGVILICIFPAFSRIPTEYSVSLRIQSECGPMWKKCGPK